MELGLPSPDTPEEILKLSEFLHLFNSESDRGAALLAGAMLDEAVLGILRAFLIPGEQTDLLLSEFNAPLGTFAARTMAAYTLGLIEKTEFMEAEIIRRIRNEFGHRWRDVSFESEKITTLANQLLWRGSQSDSESRNSRARFNMAVAMLLGDWLWRASLVEKESRVRKEWSYKAGTERHNV